MRRKKDLLPLNVSYTVDGLKWTANKMGKSLFYKNARVFKGRIISEDGPLVENPDVFYEPFDAIDHYNLDLRKAELRNLDKALKMLY